MSANEIIAIMWKLPFFDLVKIAATDDFIVFCRLWPLYVLITLFVLSKPAFALYKMSKKKKTLGKRSDFASIVRDYGGKEFGTKPLRDKNEKDGEEKVD